MLKEICDDVYNEFLLGEKSNKKSLSEKIRKLDGFFYRGKQMTLDSLEILFDLERKMIHSKGPNKQRIERTILKGLSRYTFENHYFMDTESDIKKRTSEEEQEYLIALKLVDFAEELFAMNISRDSFANKRKGLALEMLIALANHYDIPKIFELCSIALKSKKRELILSGIEFLESYGNDQDEPLHSDTIEILDEIIFDTRDRTIAVSALDIQIQKGHIGEFEAMSRLDEWKEKYLK
ncbi:conserved hypothetical protein [Desulfamplus magnetovallimortis]|uniref:Uncharacterized protein n=1 Tax=Desulfamplus magnetovallimortis TaxID=1246637 RepID=A0A1W1HD51_9BACT|nr:hypothetical protein [Desulfamplus magnetovallimortis]SLM30322.1 conserved hypothetical protein [Desulfamplus magnetovallimortis]